VDIIKFGTITKKDVIGGQQLSYLFLFPEGTDGAEGTENAEDTEKIL